MKILVSACLLGCSCRYDGKSMPNEKVLGLSNDNILIPVCPEQMGGLSTPRNPSECQEDGRVLMNDGTDVTENYKCGAEMALKIAEINDIDYAIMKAKSPSCGKGLIYDGSFQKRLIEGNGITSDLLLKEGYKVITEKDL